MNQSPFRPTIRSQADLERTWRTLMEPLGFGGHSLWLMVINPDDRPVPRLVEITDTVSPPTSDEQESFVLFLRDLDLRDLDTESIPEGARIAFLRSRPGTGGVNDDDRAWATSLYDACRVAGLPSEIVHLATNDTLVPIPMDDLPLAKPA